MEQVSIGVDIVNRRMVLGGAQRRYLAQVVGRWSDGPATLTVKRERPEKTRLQMAYYRGLVLPMIVEEIAGTATDESTARQVHVQLKAMFLPPVRIEWTDRETGEVIERELVPSLADLNTKEMTDFVEQVRRWAGEFLGLEIPDPDPQWKSRRRVA